MDTCLYLHIPTSSLDSRQFSIEQRNVWELYTCENVSHYSTNGWSFLQQALLDTHTQTSPKDGLLPAGGKESTAIPVPAGSFANLIKPETNKKKQYYPGGFLLLYDSMCSEMFVEQKV